MLYVTDNLAYNGTATQNPPNPSFPASLSIDGKRKDGMCSRTTGRSSYIQVDTGSMSVVTTVYLTFAGKIYLAVEVVFLVSAIWLWFSKLWQCSKKLMTHFYRIQ